VFGVWGTIPTIEYRLRHSKFGEVSVVNVRLFKEERDGGGQSVA